MTDERLDEIDRLTRRPDAHGFRCECIELVAELKKIREANEEMRSLRVDGEFSAHVVAERCEIVATRYDSSLHEAASLKLRTLIKKIAEMQDREADSATMFALLRRLVANHDVRCSLDHHGYCQEHNFAPPCPVPEAQKITGSGIEYAPRSL